MLHEITTEAADLGALLRESSPNQALAFARAMHERACKRHDETFVALWRDVMEFLRMDTGAVLTRRAISDGPVNARWPRGNRQHGEWPRVRVLPMPRLDPGSVARRYSASSSIESPSPIRPPSTTSA